MDNNKAEIMNLFENTYGKVLLPFEASYLLVGRGIHLVDPMANLLPVRRGML